MATIMRIGGGGGEPNILTVAVDTGAVVTATNGNKTAVATSVDGNAILKLPEGGTWSIIAELDGNTAEDSITISDDYPVEVAFGLPLSSLAVGTLIRVNENGSAVNYRVVHQGLPSSLYDASCDGTWVLREAIHSTMRWDTTDNDYENSDIHTYLNGTFLGLFDSKTQEKIKQVKIPYRAGAGYDTTVNSGSSGLSTKVFLLSGYEVGWSSSIDAACCEDGAMLSYFLAGSNGAELRKSSANYWLRTPVCWSGYGSAYVWYVNTSGVCANQYGNVTTASYVWGVRPVFILSENATVNPEPNSDGSYTLIA